MASAKRVGQEPKIEGEFKAVQYETYAVLVKDGIEATRFKTGENVEVVDTRKRVPQPDRILLDLSIQEAETLRAVCGSISGDEKGHHGDTSAVFFALIRAGIDTNDFQTGLRGTLTFPTDIRGGVNGSKAIAGNAAGPSTSGASLGAGVSPVKDVQKAYMPGMGHRVPRPLYPDSRFINW